MRSNVEFVSSYETKAESIAVSSTASGLATVKVVGNEPADFTTVSANHPGSQHQAPTLSLLPGELLIKVAGNCPPEDYVNLRMGSKKLQATLLPIPTLDHALENDILNGSLKKEAERLINSGYAQFHKRNLPLTPEVKSAISQTQISSELGTLNSTITTAKIIYHLCAEEIDNDSIVNLLEETFKQDGGQIFPIKSVFETNYRSDYIFLLYQELENSSWLELAIYDFCITNEYLKEIYERINFAFNKCTGPESLLLASLAFKMQREWCNKEMPRITQEEIKKIIDNYPLLMQTGEYVESSYPLLPSMLPVEASHQCAEIQHTPEKITGRHKYFWLGSIFLIVNTKVFEPVVTSLTYVKRLFTSAFGIRA